MEKFESFIKFLSSYPWWAKLLAVGGLLTTAVTLALAPRDSAQNTDAAADTVSFKISRVRLFGVDPEASVQVIAHINGISYQYPNVAGVEWVNVGEGMSPGTFQIPKAPRYEITFELNLKLPDTIKRLVSQEIVHVSRLPYENTYSLHIVEQHTRAAGVSASVSYSLARDL